MSTHTQPSLPHKTSPAPNFFHTYTVVVPAPLKAVYTTFGTSAGHERVCRLFSGCSAFALGERDEVAFPVAGFPEGKALVDVAVRGVHAVGGTTQDANGDSNTDHTTVVTRQHFTMEETIPVVFGLFSTTVRLTGTLSWDDAALASLSEDKDPDVNATPLYALYESIGNAGIQVWKLRIFTPDADDPSNKTQITERIEGWAPAWLRSIVQKETTKGHTAHMDLYHTIC